MSEGGLTTDNVWIEISIAFSQWELFPKSYYYFSSSIYKSTFSIRSSPQIKTDIVESVLRLQLISLALRGWLGSGEAVCHLHGTPHHAVLIVPFVRHFGRISMSGTTFDQRAPLWGSAGCMRLSSGKDRIQQHSRHSHAFDRSTLSAASDHRPVAPSTAACEVISCDVHV